MLRFLAGAGYDVTDAMPPNVEGALELWAELLNEDVRRFWPLVEPIASPGARAFVKLALDSTPELDVAGYAARWQSQQALAREWSIHQRARPLILAPVNLRQPFAPDEDIRSAESMRAIVDSMLMVVPVNLLALPSVAVPAGYDGSGLPPGVQIIGPRFREDPCLDAAAAVELALGTVTPIDPRGS